MAQSFPVHRQYAGVPAAGGKLLHKACEPLPEGGGIQHTHSSREKVSWLGMPFSSFSKEGLQESPFGVAEKFHIGAGPAAAKHSAKGNYQDVV